MGRVSARTWTRITTELVGPGRAGRQGGIPQSCIAPFAFSIKEFGILGQKLRKEFRLCLGFALGQGCLCWVVGV